MRLDRRLVFYVFAIAIVLIYGVAGTYVLGQGNNFNVKITSLNQALYFTVVTISTVGYGDITPVTGIARDFVIVLIISGLSIFLSALTVLSGEFLSARVERLYSGYGLIDRKKLAKHIVLIGYDSTNELISHRLKEQKRNFVIITSNKTTADSLRKKGYPAFAEDYTSKADMEKFNLDKATDIVIDLRDNSKTIYVVLVVKKLAKGARISVVAPSHEAEAHLADLEVANIINPVAIAADMLTKKLDVDQDSIKN
ncbi:MAG: NAD-binding protein [Candidatus Micrarchaeaceae archaeon]